MLNNNLQPGHIHHEVAPRFRFLKPGVMLFTPTFRERLKLLIGYTIRVDVLLKMQHNPGAVAVTQRMTVVETIPQKDLPQLEQIEEPEEKN